MGKRILSLFLLLFAATAHAQNRYEITEFRSIEIVTTGASTAGINISGTWTGTISFKVANGRDTTPVTVDCATPAAPGSAVNTTTGNGAWTCPVAGFSRLVIGFDAYTDGTAIVDVATASAPGQTVAAAGGGGSFDGVLVDAAGGDALTDTANNALRVNIVAGAGSGGTAIADDAAFTPGTTSVTPAGGTFDDVTPDSVNEGDAGAVRMSANRNLYVTLRDSAGNERGVTVNASNQLAVAGPVTNAGTFVVQENGAALTALQLIDNIPITIGSTTSGQSGALVMGAVTTSAPSYTTAQSAPLSLTTGGLLRVAIEAGAGSGGTAMADDAAFTVGTTSVTPVGYMLDDSATDTVNEGDIGAPRMSSNRVPFAQIRDAAGNERGANVNASNQLSVSVDAFTGTETDDGTIAGSQSVPKFAALLYGHDGSNWVRATTNADPCSGGAKVFVAISQTASTQLLTGTASNRTYVCSLVLSQPSASTQTFALVSGTGTTCGTGTAAVIGATTAANGMQIPFSAGSGAGSIAKSAANADNVCLLQSSTDRIAGVLGYVVAP